MSWLIVNGNRIEEVDKVYTFNDWDYLFSEYRITGKNPIIITGKAVVKVKEKLFKKNQAITAYKKVIIYNPIISLKWKEAGK